MFIIIFRKNQLCGGLGDRITGIISTKFIADKRNKDFFIVWDKNNISDFFDFKTCDFPESQNVHYLIDKNQDFCLDYFKKNLLDEKINIIRTNQHISRYFYKYEENYEQKILDYYDSFFEKILLPKKDFLDKVESICQNKELVGIQLRLGDRVMKNVSHGLGAEFFGESKEDIEFINSILEGIGKKCTEEKLIYVTSDCDKIYSLAKDILGIERIIYYKDETNHIDFEGKIDKTLIDFYILSKKCKKLYIEPASRFGRSSALISKTEDIYNHYSTKLNKIDLLRKT